MASNNRRGRVAAGPTAPLLAGSASGIKFEPLGWKDCAYATHGWLQLGGGVLRVSALDRQIDLVLTGTGSHCGMRFTAADARSIAAELLAAAAAMEG